VSFEVHPTKTKTKNAANIVPTLYIAPHTVHVLLFHKVRLYHTRTKQSQEDCCMSDCNEIWLGGECPGGDSVRVHENEEFEL